MRIIGVKVKILVEIEYFFFAMGIHESNIDPWEVNHVLIFGS